MLGLDLKGRAGARIYRARRPTGSFEEAGVARKTPYVDDAAVEPGSTYYYVALPWSSDWFVPESSDLKGIKPIRAKVPSAPREHHVTVTRKKEAFSIELSGQIDEWNTETRQPENYCAGPGHRNPPHDLAF